MCHKYSKIDMSLWTDLSSQLYRTSSFDNGVVENSDNNVTMMMKIMINMVKDDKNKTRA